jgi:hypothetical protein
MLQQVEVILAAVVAWLRLGVVVMGLSVALAGLVDRFVWNLPIGMPEGQALFWYVAAAGIACFACR